LPAPAEQVGMSKQKLDRITTVFKQEIDQGKLPGVVVMVTSKGKLVYSNAIGSDIGCRADGMNFGFLSMSFTKRSNLMPWSCSVKTMVVYHSRIESAKLQSKSTATTRLYIKLLNQIADTGGQCVQLDQRSRNTLRKAPVQVSRTKPENRVGTSGRRAQICPCSAFAPGVPQCSAPPAFRLVVGCRGRVEDYPDGVSAFLVAEPEQFGDECSRLFCLFGSPQSSIEFEHGSEIVVEREPAS
jgi:hypothetical protein